MARQRFIWPTIWDDPDMGRLSSDHRLLYIACFSLADDEGRILGDPVYLKSQAFRYRNVRPAKVKVLRDDLARACQSFHIYTVDDTDYIAFLNWSEFQKPKYPSPSKHPPPPADSRNGSVNDSRNDSGSASRNDSSAIPPRVGLGREGKNNPPTNQPELKDVAGGSENGTEQDLTPIGEDVAAMLNSLQGTSA
jgi:hypothetical protein